MNQPLPLGVSLHSANRLGPDHPARAARLGHRCSCWGPGLKGCLLSPFRLGQKAGLPQSIQESQLFPSPFLTFHTWGGLHCVRSPCPPPFPRPSCQPHWCPRLVLPTPQRRQRGSHKRRQEKQVAHGQPALGVPGPTSQPHEGALRNTRGQRWGSPKSLRFRVQHDGSMGSVPSKPLSSVGPVKSLHWVSQNCATKGSHALLQDQVPRPSAVSQSSLHRRAKFRRPSCGGRLACFRVLGLLRARLATASHPPGQQVLCRWAWP